MEPVQMIIIALFSAFTGWFIAWFTLQLLFAEPTTKNPFYFIFRGFVHALQSRLGNTTGKLFQHEFESSKMIEDKISDPSLFNKLKPEIEKHVDFFLNEKLATVFPLLYKFMGEKTLAQFKAAFMIEIDLLFPVIIKNYMSSLKTELRLDTMIAERIHAIPVNTIRGAFFENAKKEILYFKVVCAFIGLLMGLLLVLILWII